MVCKFSAVGEALLDPGTVSETTPSRFTHNLALILLSPKSRRSGSICTSFRFTCSLIIDIMLKAR